MDWNSNISFCTKHQDAIRLFGSFSNIHCVNQRFELFELYWNWRKTEKSTKEQLKCFISKKMSMWIACSTCMAVSLIDGFWTPERSLVTQLNLVKKNHSFSIILVGSNMNFFIVLYVIFIQMFRFLPINMFWSVKWIEHNWWCDLIRTRSPHNVNCSFQSVTNTLGETQLEELYSLECIRSSNYSKKNHIKLHALSWMEEITKSCTFSP